MKLRMSNHCGFTLVELLVVITTIVVLLALLTPAMDKAIYRAEQVRCLANIKGQYTAITTYAFDNKRSYFYRNASAPTYQRTGETPSPVDLLKSKYMPAAMIICPIVAGVPSQDNGAFKRTDWRSEFGNVGDLSWGGWDADPQPFHIYSAYMWMAAYNAGGEPITMYEDEGKPPRSIRETHPKTTLFTHRYNEHNSNSIHEECHNGRGTGVSGTFATNPEITDMPIGFGDGSATYRTRDEFKLRMFIPPGGLRNFYW